MKLGLPKGKTDAGESIFRSRQPGVEGRSRLWRKTSAPFNVFFSRAIVFGTHDRNHHCPGFVSGKLEGDEPEELEVVPWQLSDINSLLETGECTEARSIAALYMAYEYLTGHGHEN